MNLFSCLTAMADLPPPLVEPEDAAEEIEVKIIHDPAELAEIVVS